MPGHAPPPRNVLLRWIGTSLAVFVAVTGLVLLGATDSWLDRPVSEAVREGIPHEVRIALFEDALSFPGSDTVRHVALVLAVGACLALRAWWNAVLALAGSLLATAVTFALKAWIGRPRPSGPGESGAYPSGHAALTLAVFGLAAYFVWDAWRNRRRGAPGRVGRAERATVAAVATLALVVGAARVLGGVHWPSDVLGGWALGLFFVHATGLLHQELRAWQSRRHPEGPKPT